MQSLLMLVLCLKTVLNKHAHISSLTTGHTSAGKTHMHTLACILYFIYKGVHDQANLRTRQESDDKR